MTTASALSNTPFNALHIPHPTVSLRLLPSLRSEPPFANQALVKPRSALPPASQQQHAIALIALVFVAHLLMVWGVMHRTDTPRIHKALQEIELLRVKPEVQPEPPLPLPPKSLPKTAPVKAVEPPPLTQPPVALRTTPAEALQPESMAISENLIVAKTTGPVVASHTPAPTPAPKVEEPVTEPNGAAAYLNNPPPTYPRAAQRQGMQGRVLLRVHVLANGRVGNAEVKQSSGKPILDEAALSAVKEWIFTPAKRGSTAIDGWTHVPIEFKLAP